MKINKQNSIVAFLMCVVLAIGIGLGWLFFHQVKELLPITDRFVINNVRYNNENDKLPTKSSTNFTLLEIENYKDLDKEFTITIDETYKSQTSYLPDLQSSTKFKYIDSKWCLVLNMSYINSHHWQENQYKEYKLIASNGRGLKYESETYNLYYEKAK